MSVTSSDKRPLNAAQRDWLLDEVKLWQALGLVAADRADAILDLYETPRDSAYRQHSRAIFTLLAVAALFVGLAVLLLIGYNWEDMPAALKVALIFGLLLATYGLGFHLRFATGRRAAAEVVFFLGCLFYGAAIFLIAQIFHLNAHYPDGLWWWAIGVLPFALTLDTLLLHLLLVCLLAGWAGAEVLGFPDLGMWLFRRWHWLPNGGYTLVPIAALGLVWAYRKPSPAAVGLYVPLLAWWAVLQPFAWHRFENPVFFIGSVGGLLLLLAELHRPGSALAIPYRLWGALLVLGTLIPLSYADFHRELGPAGLHTATWLQPVIVAAVALSVVAVSLAVDLRGRTDAVTRPFYSLLVRQWLPLSMVVLMVILSLWEALVSDQLLRASAVPPTVLANVAMLAAAYWLVTVGLREDRGLPFAAGVAYFLLWAVLRYIDLFGGAGGMLGAALMFFLCGATIFGIALFWSRHRQETRHG